MGFTYDYAPPYYGIGSFFHVMLKFLVKDEWAWAWPFTYATVGALLHQPQTGTYANVYGLGCMLYNELPDGSLYISASWAGDALSNEQAKAYRRYAGEFAACDVGILQELHHEAKEPSSLRGHLNRHLTWVGEEYETMTKEGFVPSVEGFERISLVELVVLHPDAERLRCCARQPCGGRGTRRCKTEVAKFRFRGGS